MIPFGEWLPDLPDFQNPGCNVAHNVIPGDDAYLPLNTVVAYSDNLGSGAFRGFKSYINSASDFYTFSGDTDSLYILSSGSWSDVSGTTYSIDGRWNFSQYGDDAIAANLGDYPQKYTMGVDSAFSNLTTAFKCRYMAKVRDFLVAGYTNDSSDGTIPSRIRWSAFGDHTQWTVSPTTQSDYQDLQEVDGSVTGIVGGSYGVVFQEYAISRLTYIGSPIVFQIDRMENRGCIAPNSIIEFGNNQIAYLGNDGFYIFNGSNSIPIGDGRVNKYFFNNSRLDFLNNIYGAHDPVNHLLIWSYPSALQSNGVCDKLIIFNYSQSTKYRWSSATVTTGAIGNANLSDVATDGDALFWTTNNSFLVSVNQNGAIGTFTGLPMDATIETTEIEINPGRRTSLDIVRPIIAIKDSLSFGSNWTYRITGLSSGTAFTETAWSGSVIASVSSTGANRVMTSPDGVEWTARSAAEANEWKDIVWASGINKFIAVASSGTNRVMYSDGNGVTWSSASASEANQWESLCYSLSQGLLVAVSSDGTNRIMTSANGTSWTARSAAEANSWKAVCYSPDLDQYCAVAGDGTHRVMTSANGTTWTAQTSAEQNLFTDICWSEFLQLYVAVSSDGTNSIMTSPDGITWTATGGAYNLQSVTSAEDIGLLVAVGPSATLISKDGSDWIAPEQQPGGNDILWVDDLYLFILMNSALYLYTSRAGITGSVTLQSGERNTGSSTLWGDEISALDSGDYAMRSNARYHRIRANIAGGFFNAQGIDIINASTAGRR